MAVKKAEVYLVNFGLTVGSEIKKARLCVVISPDEMAGICALSSLPH